MSQEHSGCRGVAVKFSTARGKRGGVVSSVARRHGEGLARHGKVFGNILFGAVYRREGVEVAVRAEGNDQQRTGAGHRLYSWAVSRSRKWVV